MIKVLRRITAFLLCVLIISGICGCDFDIIGIIDGSAIEKEEAIPKIAFGTMPVSENSDETVMTVDEFNKKEIVYDSYRSDFHFEKLGDSEKILYRCLEYALENGYSYIYIDGLLISSADPLIKALNFLSLDSPLLEQNLRYETGNFTTYYEAGLLRKAKLDGIYLYVENINSALWDGKLEAIKSAKEIVAEMPDGLNEEEKAEYLHRYAVENVLYYDYPSSDGVWQYLRDTVIDGKANCDGSANMLSLLLNIAGIECFEKMYTGENIVGHTWNMINIDGEWYNADATARKENQTEETELYAKRNFAYEDRLERYVPDYSDIYPEVSKGIENRVFVHLEKLDKTAFVKTVESAFGQADGNYLLMLVDDFDKNEAEECLQRLANSVRGTVYWYSFQVVENRTAMVIYQ